LANWFHFAVKFFASFDEMISLFMKQFLLRTSYEEFVNCDFHFFLYFASFMIQFMKEHSCHGSFSEAVSREGVSF